MPLFWATSAYVGNGVMGLRVQAESGADGVFQLLLDNNNAGRGGHRQPTGYFRLHTNAANTSLPLHVTLRQVIYHGVLEANVTDHSGASVCSFTAFVNAADTDKPVAVIDIVISGRVACCEVVSPLGRGRTPQKFRVETGMVQ